MIPLRDKNPTSSVPFVTWLLVAANVAVFALQASASDGRTTGLLAYAMVPVSVVTGRPVPGLPPVAPWLTILTSMFMHGGLLHLGSNMLYLVIFGNNIEDRLGHMRFLFFYVACGVIAAAAQIASSPLSHVPTLGASGAVAGTLGAYLMLYPGAAIVCLVPIPFWFLMVDVPALIVIGFWIAGQFLSATMHSGSQVGGGIAYWAHIGGFFAGIILLTVLGGRSGRRGRRDAWRR